MEVLGSLKTSVVLLLFLLIVLFAGACIMPANNAVQSIHALPLLEWIVQAPVGTTWWLWVAMAIIALLAVNTLVCSVQSLLNKKKVAGWLILISPQIIHIGFLCMFLAHFMSSIGGFRSLAVAREGTVLQLPNGSALSVRDILISVDSYGYLSDGTVSISYWTGGRIAGEGVLMPNRPSFHEGIGVHVKDLRAFPERAVLLEIYREPGAAWALVGGVVFMIGTVTPLVLKTKKELVLNERDYSRL
ncbi:MAG TPA: hypothetical protein VEI96_00295 [Thermodesulfovibrionales bacterium]|nr:hypothetical protein [Thermodesulfovibrionales bacterium]